MTQGQIESTCDTLDEHGFYQLPKQYELRDYDTTPSFAASLSGSVLDRLVSVISGRGAFRQFMDEVRRLGIEDHWYDCILSESDTLCL